MNNDRPTGNPTPNVQVEEIGLEEQTSIGKVIAGAGIVAVVAAGLMNASRQKKPEPQAPVESSREYLKSALAQAQEHDLTRKARKQARKAAKQSTAEFDKIGKKIGEQVASAQDGSRSFLDAIKASGPEIERLLEAEVLPKLKEFGEEARQISEQGKMKSAEIAQKTKTEFASTSEKLTERAAEVVARAESDVLPTVKTRSAELAEQAKLTTSQIGADARDSMHEIASAADEKRKIAVESAREGGRDTRSLLIWMAAAGALVYGTLLDEQQQQKVKDTVGELSHEVQTLIKDFTSK